MSSKMLIRKFRPPEGWATLKPWMLTVPEHGTRYYETWHEAVGMARQWIAVNRTR